MEWDVMDSASQVVRRKDICAIGRGVRDGFESDRTFWLGRRGASSSTSRPSSNLVRDIDYDVFCVQVSIVVSRRHIWRFALFCFGVMGSLESGEALRHP